MSFVFRPAPSKAVSWSRSGFAAKYRPFPTLPEVSTKNSPLGPPGFWVELHVSLMKLNQHTLEQMVPRRIQRDPHATPAMVPFFDRSLAAPLEKQSPTYRDSFWFCSLPMPTVCKNCKLAVCLQRHLRIASPLLLTGTASRESLKLLIDSQLDGSNSLMVGSWSDSHNLT